MRKEISLTLTLALLISLVGCNKSTAEPTETSSDNKSSNAIVIETYGTDNGEEVLPTFDIHIPEYKVKDCELEVDTDNHTIKGQYVDRRYTIDFDLTYYDYGVNEVSVYEGSPTKKLGKKPVSLLDTLWVENTDDYTGAITTFSNDEQRRELSIQSALTYKNEVVDSNEDVLEIIELINEYGKYNIFPYYCSYDYPIAAMNASVSNDWDIYNHHKDVEMVKFITLRTELGGLPIGIYRDNRFAQYMIRYGKYDGSFFDTDDYDRGFYKASTCTQVDFIYYNYNADLIEESTVAVMPIESCILNVVPGIINIYGLGDCHVYAAELVYIPFYEGCDFNSEYYCLDPYFIPVWAIYVTSVGANNTRAYAIYLNATTGELVSYGT